MKKIRRWCWLVLLAFVYALPMQAQDYERMWREVEVLQKKDLPKSVIEAADRIYRQAEADRNIPQMMKACLVKGDYQAMLSPDSSGLLRERLCEWAGRETDVAGRAMLNSLLGTLTLEQDGKAVDEAVKYFRLSVQPAAELGKLSAKNFVPMTGTGKLSERYFDDNLYDLLVRQAVRSLSERSDWKMRLPALEECLSLYDGLIAYYGERQRTAALLVKETRLMFRFEYMGGYRDYASTVEERIESFRLLAEEYQDLPACVDVYAKMAEVYWQENRYEDLVKVAREGMERYPKSEGRKALQEYINVALHPALSVSTPFIYPGREVDLEVRYANLKGMTLELYRLNLPPSSAKLQKLYDDKWEKLIAEYGRKAGSRHYGLRPTPDYQPKDTTLRYTIPEAGVYVIKQIPDGHPKRTYDYTLLYVSSLQVISLPVDEKREEFVIVDRLSGNPVSGVELVVYRERSRNEGGYEQIAVHPSDGRGRVELAVSLPFYYNARVCSDDSAPVGWLHRIGNFAQDKEEKWVSRSTLFTDRSLYRPGQTVRISGIAYEQWEDSTRVLKYADQMLKLYNTDRDIQEVKLPTDELGVFSANFVLPQQLLPGIYYLSCYGSTITIRVEEYKRPAFEVAFTPYAKTYNMGDSIQVEGQAVTFAGAPVRSAKVKYTLTRGQRLWWRPYQNESELASGEVRTDADGRFTVGIRLAQPEVLDWGEGRSYYIYKVKAEVTDGAGETRQGELSLPVGKQSIGLQIRGLEEYVMREKQPKLQFRAMNLNQEPVRTKVDYKVYRLNEKEEKGEQVLGGSAESQQSFVPTELWNLPSARYRMEISATDEQGRLCTSKQDFMLLSQTDHRLPTKMTSWFCQDGKRFNAGEVPTLYFGTSEENVYLLVDIYSGKRRIGSQRLTLNNEIRKFTYPYKEEYGEGISVYFSMMRKGNLYTYSAQITRPEPEKKLALKWETFRDKLVPGSREEWTLCVGKGGGDSLNPVSTAFKSNLMAVLYDASLDRIHSHDWNFRLNFYRNLPYVGIRGMNACQSFGLGANFPYPHRSGGLNLLTGSYGWLYLGPNRVQIAYNDAVFNAGSRAAVEIKYLPPAGMTDVEFQEEKVMVSTDASSLRVRSNSKLAEPSVMFSADVEESLSAEVGDAMPVDVRENFAETAFFYPNLRADSLGRVRISFIVPEALTEWKFMGFAHTEDMDYGFLQSVARTGKDFMVQPNLPRFVRKGDRTVLAASLVNLSMEIVEGKAQLELFHPLSGKTVYRKSQPFRVEEGETGTVRFEWNVPKEHDILVCRITAASEKYSDGEQHYLPILSDRQWVTETVPSQLRGEDSVTVRVDDLYNGDSRTVSNHRLTVELVANPDWYVIQALPVVSNPMTDDALSWGVAYYANVLSRTIVAEHPDIRKVLDTWKLESEKAMLDGRKETLQSDLEQNQDLKNIMLAETPWLAEAAKETERKRQVLWLLDENGMEYRRKAALDKLTALQSADGSWSWYKGMTGNCTVTVQLTELLARLQALPMAGDSRKMYVRALSYLEEQADMAYKEMLRDEEKYKQKQYPGEQLMRYLYITAIDSLAASRADRKLVNGVLERLSDRSAWYSVYEKSLVAIIMHTYGRQRQAEELLQSVREYAVRTSDMGVYFETPKAGYSWRSYKIPTQTIVMEAIRRIALDVEMLDGMKLWLLKQKQVQAWENPLATADAVYAFVAGGESRLQAEGQMSATIGKEKLQTSADALGAVRRTWNGTDARVKEVEISRRGNGVGWGTVYVQYLENTDKVGKKESGGLSIEREYFRNGEKLDAEASLYIGDKLTVRLTVRTDRDMDFVQVKDSQMACMEPESQLSGYHWNGKSGYYAVMRDASAEFFIDRMPKGTYQLEYTVYVNRAGTYRSGVATIQSAYAPEYSGHTGGTAMSVH